MEDSRENWKINLFSLRGQVLKKGNIREFPVGSGGYDLVLSLLCQVWFLAWEVPNMAKKKSKKERNIATLWIIIEKNSWFGDHKFKMIINLNSGLILSCERTKKVGKKIKQRWWYKLSNPFFAGNCDKIFS